MTLLVRTAGDPLALLPRVEEAVTRLDDRLPLDDVTTVEAELAVQLRDARFLMTVLGSLATVGVLLSLAGLYGVLAYAVDLRRKEIGIRLTVGASPASTRSRVLRHSAALVVLGVALGVPGAWYGARILEGFLYGVTALDPRTWAGALGVLTILALAASLPPARRATRVQPMEALRAE
jgi:putative ABC transport system permease protein